VISWSLNPSRIVHDVRILPNVTLIFREVIINICKDPIRVNWILNRNQMDFDFFLIHHLFVSTFLLTAGRSVETVRLRYTPARFAPLRSAPLTDSPLLFPGCSVGMMTPLACRELHASGCFCPLLTPCSASCSSLLIVHMTNAVWFYVRCWRNLQLSSHTTLSYRR